MLQIETIEESKYFSFLFDLCNWYDLTGKHCTVAKNIILSVLFHNRNIILLLDSLFSQIWKL